MLAACTKDAPVVPEKGNVLANIERDIQNGKFYPNEPNRYDYSSDKFAQFVRRNSAVYTIRDSRTSQRGALSLAAYKDSVVAMFSATHNAQQIEEMFATTQQAVARTHDPIVLLDSLHQISEIPLEQKQVLQSYLTFFKNETDDTRIRQVASIYLHHINAANFTELEKRGMLTVVDIFSENTDLFRDETLVFSQIFGIGTVNRPSKDTRCGGNIIVGIVLGAVTGNGVGAVVGGLGGVWQSYSEGCFDN